MLQIRFSQVPQHGDQDTQHSPENTPPTIVLDTNSDAARKRCFRGPDSQNWIIPQRTGPRKHRTPFVTLSASHAPFAASGAAVSTSRQYAGRPSHAA
jgi:hypothetical protein